MLVRITGSCQLMSHVGQFVRFGGFPRSIHALHILQLGEVRRRCRGILDLSNRLLRRRIGLGRVGGGVSSRSESSEVIDCSVVSAKLWLWSIELFSFVLAGLTLVEAEQSE